ncbi:MAG: DUF2066 domain-containing protein [Gammaproteobacteria bacterium]|nr:DUF2066 domain-containing protein [Gammaproteobacteria bacterium]MCP5137512.1 DUF2066 domain-containing protein [Gammaproteobacteria bacterium]
MPRLNSKSVIRFLFAALFTALSTALFAVPASAVPVNNLYEANVPAGGQDEGNRNAALAEALAEVLTKVSGQSDVRGNTTVRNAMARASAYAQTFSFTRKATTGRDAGLRLAASFYPPSIDQLLSEAGLPIWGKERPQTIIWLAVETDGNRYLLPADGGALVDAVQLAADTRGLPISLPLMDIDDRQALSFSDVTGGFIDRVIAASRRYDGNSVLIGHLRQRGSNDWDARWTHLLGGVQRDWLGNGGSLWASLTSGIDGTADALASRYALKSGDASTVEMSVRGVQGLADYANTVNYLTGLSVVESVQPRVVMPGQMLLTVTVRGGRQALADVVALGRLLETDSSVVDSGSGPLAYVVLH